MDADYTKFFLKPDDLDDDFKFLSPARKDIEFEHLIDGIPTFKATEEAIFSAKKNIYISFWIFNPKTPVSSKKVRSEGIKNWASLLRIKAANSVRVHVYLNDFDPIFQNNLHQYAWRSYRTLLKEAKSLAPDQRENFQVISLHNDATVKTGIQDKLEGSLVRIIENLNKTLKKNSKTALYQYSNMPGLWSLIYYSRKKNNFSLTKHDSLTAYPAAHHQKFCVIDDSFVICGGLDVNKGRMDTPKHNSRVTSWHDINCMMRGEIAADVARNFVGIWNRGLPRFKSFLSAVNQQNKIVSLPLSKVGPLKFSFPQKIGTKGKAIIQLHRTLSVEGVWTVPSNVRDDIAKAYENAIEQANKFIYIENQYVRSERLTQWIIKKYNEKHNLQVIIVLPVAPEEVAQKGGTDEITMHGLYLQHKILTELKLKLGKNIGLYSMIKRSAAEKAHPTNMFGSYQIYVHSKTMIVDDKYVIIGSANTNERSFQVDTELNVGVYDPEKVKRFRLRLWFELLGTPIDKWKSDEFVRNWEAHALANTKRSPNTRKGFIVPHDKEKFVGKKGTWIPDEFAQIFDLDVQKNGDIEIA